MIQAGPSPAVCRTDCADTRSPAKLKRSSWSWDELTLIFDYDEKLSADLASLVFPSTGWTERALTRPSFHNVTVLHRTTGSHRGAVTDVRAISAIGASLRLLFP